MLQLRCIALKLQFKSVLPAACTSNSSERLPNRETIELKKIKDLDFSREDLGQRGKKRPVVDSLKKRFNPPKNCDLKPLSMKDFAEAY